MGIAKEITRMTLTGAAPGSSAQPDVSEQAAALETGNWQRETAHLFSATYEQSTDQNHLTYFQQHRNSDTVYRIENKRSWEKCQTALLIKSPHES